MKRAITAYSWRRASLALVLVYVLAIKLVLGSMAIAAPSVDGAGFAGIICHDPVSDTAPDGPAPQPDHHCDECCLACGLAGLDAPPILSTPFAFARPAGWLVRKISYAHELGGPSVEAWWPPQAQRGPPRT